ncbi:hypothetical protein [Actinocrispum wychmicini]|uniref:Lipoprotein LprG n=1 Tax=Actinocrispum wychmicini TaxID=1213861 RepID=A0A4R2JTY6_9PSEU|nr:hypothetical protein [Actinocrispum wychmicini]TCO62482.1 hypothetical protein EV192_102620 [Actinocrispum wychmicini]
MRTRHTLVAVAALSTLALAGCEKSALPGVPQPADGPAVASGGASAKPDKPSGNNSAPADPKALIANAAKSSKDASTYKFEWKLSDKGGTGNFQTSGEVDTKNERLKGESSMGGPDGGAAIKVSILVVDKTMYMKAGPAPKWTKFPLEDMTKELGSLGGGASGGGKTPQPGTDPMGMLDPIKDFATTTPDGSDTVRGAPATRYKVAVDPSKVGEIGGDPADAKGTDMKVWIDGQGRLVKFSIAMPGLDGGMNAEFFDYGAPVSIQAPPDSEVQPG